MGRIRTIKPEFPQSESIGRLSRDARLLFIQLWTICDDSGRSRASSRMLASLLYPYDSDAVRLMDRWLTELEKENCIKRYSAEGSSYLEICKWLTHQKIDHPSQSKLPAFVASSRDLANYSEVLAPDLRPVPVPVPVKDQEAAPERRAAKRGQERGQNGQQWTGVDTNGHNAEADTDTNPLSPPTEPIEDLIGASMAVSGLIQLTGIHTQRARIVLDQMAMNAERGGADLKAWVQTMFAAWQLLEISRAKLEYSWGAEKFFGEGHYKNAAGWPWKEGCAPQRPIPQTQPEFQRPERSSSMQEIREKLMAGSKIQ